ncbi:MAG: hypothetical protein U9M96_01625, partial [Thermodesulfobacteriota bacterium]|nr:hypothetical protein [Thermodesulfobacteriota bacterium]
RVINLKQFIIGISVFLFGSLEYLLTRPVDSTCMEKIVGWFRGGSSGISIYGDMGGFIPEFAHPLSFALITMALFPGSSRKTRGFICFFWLCIELFFEMGQKFGSEIVLYMPSFFDRIWLLDNLRPYFMNGTYDSLDVFAIFLGIGAAYLVGELTATVRDRIGVYHHAWEV